MTRSAHRPAPPRTWPRREARRRRWRRRGQRRGPRVDAAAPPDGRARRRAGADWARSSRRQHTLLAQRPCARLFSRASRGLPSGSMTPRIGDYATIGDCRAAALVSRARLDRLAVLAALRQPVAVRRAARRRRGRPLVARAGGARSRRGARYLDGHQRARRRVRDRDAGASSLTDFMPVASEEDKRRTLFRRARDPAHRALRRAARSSSSSASQPRPDYGARPCALRDGGALGLRVETRARRSLVAAHRRAARARRRRRVRATRAPARRRRRLRSRSPSPTTGRPSLPPLGAGREQRAAAHASTGGAAWPRALRYDGPFARRRSCAARSPSSCSSTRRRARSSRRRRRRCPSASAATSTGTIASAGCATRRSTVRALFGPRLQRRGRGVRRAGCCTRRGSRARSCRSSTTCYGNRPADERTLSRWRGYRGSRPVRIGNAARRAAPARRLRRGHRRHRAARARAARRSIARPQRMLRGFGDYVCGHWRVPDEGIWEPRSGRAPHTHSRLLVLGRARSPARAARARPAPSLPTSSVSRARAPRSAREIETRAWNPRAAAATSPTSTAHERRRQRCCCSPGTASKTRARRACARPTRAIARELGAGDGLLYRYRDGESPGEGAFGICSFWARRVPRARRRHRSRRRRRARRRSCAHANDVGLFAEEIDPASGDALGNFPQAFTHVGLINAALTLARRRARDDGDARAARGARMSLGSWAARGASSARSC